MEICCQIGVDYVRTHRPCVPALMVNRSRIESNTSTLIVFALIFDLHQSVILCSFIGKSTIYKYMKDEMEKPREKALNTELTARPFFNRKSPRADFHNYSGGLYFVTICTDSKIHYFGEVINEEMQYSYIGKFCKQQLEEINSHYPYAEIPLFVVMPNHIHAIIRIECPNEDILNQQRNNMPSVRSLLSVVIGGLKRTVTMYARLNNLYFR